MKEGFYNNISIEDYHKGDGISASSLKKALKSTAHFFVKDEPQEEKSHFNVGQAFEDLFVEGDLSTDKFWVFDESERPIKNSTFAKTENKEWKEKIFEENEGKRVLTSKEMQDLKGMIEVCKSEHIQKTLQGKTIPQGSAYWIDEESGLLCKTRPDLIKERNENEVVLIDIKSAKDGSPNGFAKAFCNLNYGIQAVMQIDGIEKVLKKKVAYYIYLVVETSAPYNATFYLLDEEDIEIHRTIYKNLLMNIKHAKENPERIKMGYAENVPGGVLTLKVPSWHYNK